MNGRVYDPVLGRFLSADPNVDDVEDAQGYNRYIYVGNNPMNATDPSGFFKLKDALKIAAVVVIAVVAAIYLGPMAGQALGSLLNSAGLVTTWTAATEAVIMGAGAGLTGGFAAGFAGSLLNGGSVGDAFRSGLIGGIAGALTAGIGAQFGHASGSFANEAGRAVSHGIVGGAIEEARGGEFRHGFYSGVVGSLSGSITGSDSLNGNDWGDIAERTIIAAAAGGTASALSGGNFANGAETAAFQHLLNAEGKNLIAKSGETAATIKGKLAHVGFDKGVKVADGVITDGLVETSKTVEVRELKPLTRLANMSKYNAAEVQLLTQMDAVATSKPGKAVSGSLWSWVEKGGKFTYSKLLTIRLSVVNFMSFVPGIIADYEVWSHAQKSGVSWSEQMQRDTGKYPYLDTPLGRIPNPYWDKEL